jgi:hypothetical protein
LDITTAETTKALPVAKEKKTPARVEASTAQLVNKKEAPSAALSFATVIGVGVGLMALLMPRP